MITIMTCMQCKTIDDMVRYGRITVDTKDYSKDYNNMQLKSQTMPSSL